MSGVTLSTLAPLPRWVAWQQELRGAKPTKMPWYSADKPAKADDPRTWRPRAEAEQIASALPKPFGVAGVGIVFGALGEHTGIGGIDYDSCLADGKLAPWAQELVYEANTYTEI